MTNDEPNWFDAIETVDNIESIKEQPANKIYISPDGTVSTLKKDELEPIWSPKDKTPRK